MNDILSDLELSKILDVLKTSPLEWVGNEKWAKQMSMLERLNVQAALEARRGGEERVRDALVEAEKVPLLVHELILLELWRKQVLPELLKLGKPQSSFQVINATKVRKWVCSSAQWAGQSYFVSRFTW